MHQQYMYDQGQQALQAQMAKMQALQAQQVELVQTTGLMYPGADKISCMTRISLSCLRLTLKLRNYNKTIVNSCKSLCIHLAVTSQL